MRYIKRKVLLGIVVANVHVVKFRKSGLPQAHCQLFLNKGLKDKFNDAVNTEKLVTAVVSLERAQKRRTVMLKRSALNLFHERSALAV